VPFVSQPTEPYVGPVGRFHRLHEELRRAIRASFPRGRVYKGLGTDGFGRSDSEANPRCASNFEINRHYIAVRR